MAASVVRQSGILSHSFDSERQTVQWELKNGIVIVSHLRGRNAPIERGVPGYPDEKEFSKCLEIADIELANGEGVAYFPTYKEPIYGNETKLYRCIHPEIHQAIIQFSRFPNDIDDFETPFESIYLLSLARKIHTLSSSLCLTKIPSQTSNFNIQHYFTKNLSHIPDWADFANEYYFSQWKNSGTAINGYRGFSSLIWGVFSNFILGLPRDNHVDYSSIWSTIFSSERDKAYKLFVKLFHFDMGFSPMLHGHIESLLRKYLDQGHSTHSNYYSHEDFIHYWLSMNATNTIMNDFRAEDWKKFPTESNNLKDTTHLLFSNLTTIIIMMQEKIAFLLTEACRRLAINPHLAAACRDGSASLKLFVLETLRMSPPAESIRQFRWDTDIYWKDKKYEVQKEELISAHPILAAHNPDVYHSPDEFRLDRHRYNSHCPFGHGQNHCPGETFSILFTVEILKLLLSRYELTCDNGDKEPSLIMGLTLRHSPSVKLRLSDLKHEQGKF